MFGHGPLFTFGIAKLEILSNLRISDPIEKGLQQKMKSIYV